MLLHTEGSLLQDGHPTSTGALLKGGFYLIVGVRHNMISDFWLTSGGRGVWTPPFLADIICEQPLSRSSVSLITQISFVKKSEM